MSETARTAVVDPPETESDTSVSESGTTRDQVWDVTLVLISERPLPFQIWRVRDRAGLDKSHHRTIRRTLSVMVAAGWLTHEKNSNWWYPGPKAEERLYE